VNYYVSGRYYDQDGIFKVVTDKYQDYSFRAKFDAKLNDWLKWSTNVSLNNNNYKYSGVSNYEMTIARLESNISPSFVPFNPDGTVMQYTNQLYANSPIGAGDGGYLTSGKGRNNKNRNMVSMVNGLELSLMKELRFNVNYGYTQNKNLYRYRGNSFEYSRSEGIIQEFTSGSIYDYYREVQSAPIRHLLDYYLTFDKTWNNAHNLKVVGGSQYETYRTVSTDTSMTNLSNDDLDSFSAVTPESVLSLSQTINAYKTLGFFGRVNYDYLSKYLVEFSARADGSSRFQENHRWGFFPSMSAGWRMSEEDFFAPAKDYVDNLKVRLSVGSLGNQQVDYYAYLQTITTDNLMNYTFDGNSKISNARITDPVSSGLTWETVTTYNVGLDMTFLRNRLNVSTDYYIRHTKDMLIQSLTLPDVYGANTPLYYPEIPSGESRNLFTHIFHLLENGSIMAYEYLDGREEYTEENKIDWQEFIDRFNIYHDTVNGNILVNDADIPSREVLGYYVKEIYYMEKSTSAFRVKTLAICPILHRIENFDAVSTRYPLFWIPYSEIEPYTRQIPVMASSLNNSLLGTIDDFFQQRRYKGEIYKTGNSRNLLIAQYTSSPEEMKAEQERIEKELTDFERNLTADKSGRISQPTQQQNRSNKRLTLRSQSTPSASQSMRDRRY
jgi:gliding motility associated protien GldN